MSQAVCGRVMALGIADAAHTDAAKAVQLCLANDVRTVDEVERIKGGAEVKPPTVRQISIPTTLSAGEFSGSGMPISAAMSASALIASHVRRM